MPSSPQRSSSTTNSLLDSVKTASAFATLHIHKSESQSDNKGGGVKLSGTTSEEDVSRKRETKPAEEMRREMQKKK